LRELLRMLARLLRVRRVRLAGRRRSGHKFPVSSIREKPTPHPTHRPGSPAPSGMKR
jgi:hypothetical protein